MKPNPRSDARQLDLFESQFDQLTNLNHPLCILATKIYWNRFDVAFTDCYFSETGAPDKDIRLLVGLHSLKLTFNNDEAATTRRKQFDFLVRRIGDPRGHRCAL